MPFEEYNPTVLDHFLNPRNTGEVSQPSVTTTVTNPVCGDMMKLTLRIEKEVIMEAKAKTFGCAAAIACSSALTELLRGKSVGDARQVSNQQVMEYLGGLPESKTKCSLIAEEAVREALRCR